MTIEEWPFSDARLLQQIWAVATADAPYCYPVGAESFADGMTAVKDDESFVTNRNERLLVASKGSRPLGFAHLCAAPVTLDEEKVECGIIRFLAFAPDSLTVGQTLIDRAEAILSRDGYHHIDAFSAFHGYPYHNHTRGFLSDRLKHISSLLLDNGYQPHDPHLTLVRHTNAAVSAKPDIEVRIEKELGAGRDAEVMLKAFHGIERIGMCRFYSSRRYADSETLEPYGYIRFIGTNEGYRRRGIGRYLLKLAFDEMRSEGYERSVLNCREKNTAALSLYQTSDYSTDDIARAYCKHLGP